MRFIFYLDQIEEEMEERNSSLVDVLKEPHTRYFLLENKGTLEINVSKISLGLEGCSTS